MRFDAVILDFGNTLVPWTDAQTAALADRVRPAFEEALGPLPRYLERVLEARRRLWAERAETTMREVTVEEWVDEVCDGDAPAGLAAEVRRRLHAGFVEICATPPGLRTTLERLAARAPLAVLSNFSLEDPILEVLDRAGVRDLFRHVEVSAARGLAKPHPEPFEVVRDVLGAPMERTLMVGDDFWNDIVGAYRAGLLTALTHEHQQGPTSDPRAPDVRPDQILQSLADL